MEPGKFNNSWISFGVAPFLYISLAFSTCSKLKFLRTPFAPFILACSDERPFALVLCQSLFSGVLYSGRMCFQVSKYQIYYKTFFPRDYLLLHELSPRSYLCSQTSSLAIYMTPLISGKIDRGKSITLAN